MSTATPSMTEQVAAVQAHAAQHLPAHVLETFGHQIAGLIADGVPAGVASPGQRISDAPLLTATGEATTLHATTDERPAVLVFYRGAWCPYCNVALRVYADQLLPSLQERGVTLVAISPQTPDGSLSMQEKHALEFPVVSDPSSGLARELGILMPPRSAEVRVAQEELGLQLESVNADGAEDLPMATVAVLGADHTLRWIDVRPDFTARTEPREILAALDRVG